MKNLFSLTTNKIFYPQDNDDFLYSPDNNKETQLRELIYRYIPLEGNALYGFNQFKDDLIKEINEKNAASDIELLADLTLKLCKPFLKYEVPERNSNTIINSGEFYPDGPIQGFQHYLYNNSYEDELKTFMILSYAYSQSKKHIIKKNAIYKILKSRTPNPPEASRPVYDHLYKIYNNNKEFNTVFLASFLNYQKQSIVATSWYDSEIILGLTASSVKSKNPFISSKTNEPTNMKSFIKSFQDINLNKNNRINVLSCIDRAYIKSDKITESKIYMFNQFILERIGSFNLINRLAFLQQKIPLPIENLTFLVKLVNCPLLRFRIKLLDYFETQYEEYFKNNRLELPEWDLFLRISILHLLTCTLPILDLVFHYLAYLATNECSFSAILESSINNYFDKLATNKSFIFFKYSDTGSFIPTPIYQFPSNIYDRNYIYLCDMVYKNLISQSIQLSENENILKKLNNIYSAQQNLLKKELLPIGL